MKLNSICFELCRWKHAVSVVDILSFSVFTKVVKPVFFNTTNENINTMQYLKNFVSSIQGRAEFGLNNLAKVNTFLSFINTNCILIDILSLFGFITMLRKHEISIHWIRDENEIYQVGECEM